MKHMSPCPSSSRSSSRSLGWLYVKVASQVRDLKQDLGTAAPVFLWKTINPGHYDCDSAPSAHGPIASFEAYKAEVLRHPASDLPLSDKHRYWYPPSLVTARPCSCSSSPCPPALAVRFLITFFFFFFAAQS